MKIMSFESWCVGCGDDLHRATIGSGTKVSRQTSSGVFANSMETIDAMANPHRD
jgi:hypothetical protein